MKKSLLKAFIFAFALVSLPLVAFADDNVETETDLLEADSTLADGYYYLRAENDAKVNNVKQEAYAYALYREGKWLLGANHKLYENDPSTIFKITSDGTGKYTFENLGTQSGHYMQSTVSGTKFSNTIEFVNDATIRHEIRFRNNGTAYIIGANNTLHYRIGGQTLVKNNGTDNTNAHWTFVPVTEAKVQQVLARRALLDAEAAYDSAFVYTYDITKGLITKASQFSALGTASNANFGQLIDNNQSSYLSFNQNGSSANPRYLQVDLGDNPVQSFVFKYARCLDSHTYRLRDVIVYASNDASTWTEVRTLRFLPVNTSSNGFYSGGITMDQPYRYLRFEVLALALNDVGSLSYEQLRLSVSEFQIYAATRNEALLPGSYTADAAQAINTLQGTINSAKDDAENAQNYTATLNSQATAVRNGVKYKGSIMENNAYTSFFSGEEVRIPSELTAYYVNSYDDAAGTLGVKPVTDVIPAATGVILEAKVNAAGTDLYEGKKMYHSFFVTYQGVETPDDNLLDGSDDDATLSGTNYNITGNNFAPYAEKNTSGKLSGGLAILPASNFSGDADTYPVIINALTTLRQAIVTATTFEDFSIGKNIGQYTLPEPLKTNYEKALADARNLAKNQSATDEQYAAATDSVLKYRAQIDEQLDDLVENEFKEGFYRIENKNLPGYYIHCDHLSGGGGKSTIYGSGAVTDLKNVPGYYANLTTATDNSTVFYIRQKGENWVIQSARNQTWNGGGQDQGYLKGALYDESKKGTIKFTNLSETEQVIEQLGGEDFTISFAHNQRNFSYDKNKVVTDNGTDDLNNDANIWHFITVDPSNTLYYNMAMIQARGALTYYPAGTNPGFVPAELSADLEAKMKAASASDTASITALNEATAAYIATAANNIIPVTPGYYYIVNAYEQFKMQRKDRFERVMEGVWNQKNGEHINYNVFSDPKTTAYVFRLTDKDKTFGSFNMYSLSRNLYAQKTADTKQVKLAADTTTGQMFLNRYAGFYQVVGEDLKTSPYFTNNPSYGTYGSMDVIARASYYLLDGYAGNWYLRKANTTVSVNDEGFGTLYAPFPTVIPSGVKVYAVSAVEGDQATLTEIKGTVLAARTPVIVVAKPNTYTFESTLEAGTGATTNLLSGTDVAETRRDSTIYSLQFTSDNTPVLNIAAGNSAKLTGWSAYLVYDEATTTSDTLHLTGYQLPEGIATVTVNDNILNDNKYYDLQGRRVVKPTKGIYIRNGKKVYIDK